MKPDYVLRKSIIKSLNVFLILGSILVVPLVVQIVKIINALSDKTVFYGRKIVRSKGVIHKDKRQSELTGSFKVKVIQTKIGTFFNYGDVQVEGHDKWKFTLVGVKKPYELKKYLEEIQGKEKFKL